MQRNLLSLILALLLPLTLTAQAVELIPLNNYFVKNTVKLNAGLNAKVFRSPKAFDACFGVAKTASNAVTVPDFQSFQVISIARPASNMDVTLSIDSARLSGKTLRIYCSSKRGAQQNYTTVPTALMMIKNDQRIKQYYFYEKGMRTLKVKCSQ